MQVKRKKSALIVSHVQSEHCSSEWWLLEQSDFYTAKLYTSALTISIPILPHSIHHITHLHMQHTCTHTHTHSVTSIISSQVQLSMVSTSWQVRRWNGEANKPWLVFCICAAFLHAHVRIDHDIFLLSFNERKKLSIVAVTQCVNVNK